MGRTGTYALLIFALAATAARAAAQKFPQPRCFQTSRGVYVEGTLPLSCFAALSPNSPPSDVPKRCWPRAFGSKDGQLASKNFELPPPVTLSVGGTHELKAYIRERDSSGRITWKCWKLCYNHVNSLAYGFIPRPPLLTTGQTAIIGTAATAAITVLTTSSKISNGWKLGLGITGIGIAGLIGVINVVQHYGVPPHHYGRVHENYYLAVRYGNKKVTRCKLRCLRTEEMKSAQYVPKGEVVVFAMDMRDFWGVANVLQSRTGLPLQALPTPGQAAK